MSDFLLWEQRDNIVILTMNQPAARNALGKPEQFQAFVSTCERINADETVSVAILTGAGEAFCAGGNVKDMINRAGMFAGDPMTLRRRYQAGVQRIPMAMEALEVPIIAAVNGPAIGAGCDLACMCDLRIASTKASFGEVFVKLGLIPGDGGCWFLQRAVGYAKAAEMIFTGDPISAREALECGLVSKVVEPEALLDVALALASRIAANSGDAVRMAKRLLREAEHSSLGASLEMAASFQAIAHHGEGHARALHGLRGKVGRPERGGGQ